MRVATVIRRAFTGTVDFDPGAAVFNLVSAGARDGFVLQFDSAGNFVWANRMGGTTTDQGQGVAVDSTGNVYATGFFEGSADFGPFILTSTPTVSGPRGDAFITKLDGAGNFVWAKGLGGAEPNGADVGFDMAVDALGNNYTIGGFRATVDFDPTSVTPGDTLNSNGLAEVFVLKQDTAGNFLWVRGFGDFSDDAGYSIALDGSNNVLATGFFRGTVDFDRTTVRPDDTLTVTGPGGGPAGAGRDAYVLKLTDAGTFVWVRGFGGVDSTTPGTADDADEGHAIAVDSADNVYLTGLFQNTPDFDPGIGSHVVSSFGGQDVFVSKFDSAGNFVYVRQLGGADTDVGEALAVGSTGNLFVGGTFVGTADFDPSPLVFNLTSNGNNTNADMFLTTLLPCSLTVTHTGDGGPGSLREAIDCANATAGADTIDFQIPATDAGFVDVDSTLAGGDAAPDAFVIKPLSPLPALTDTSGGTTIDGRTQAAFGGDTNPFGPEIVLQGGPRIIPNPTPASGDGFGIWVADLGGDVLIGSRLDDLAAADAGAAYKYNQAGTQVLAIGNPQPTTLDSPQVDSFASSDGVAAVGSNIVVGAGGEDLSAAILSSGAAYLFDGTTGATLLSIDNPAPVGNGNFGKSVAAQGTNIVVGAPGNTPGVFQTGEVYMFDGNPSSATFGNQLHVFANPDPQSQDFFGWSVAAVGTNILVGARTDDTGALNAGIAYLFDGDPSSGTFGDLLATFLNPSPASGDQFGYDVAALGNNALIGTQAGDEAYLFDADPSSGTFGTLLATFSNPNPNPADEFGAAVGALGNLAVVGAHFDDDTASGTVTDAGAVYLFDTTGSLVGTIFNPTPEVGDGFGFAVTDSGGRLAIGSILDDAGGPYAVNEGAAVQLDGSGSFDPDQSTASLTFEWDLDGDNVFGETGVAAARGDEVGINPTFSAAGLDGPSSVMVALRVTDNASVSDTDEATIDIANVAPTVDAIAGPIDPVDINDQPVSVEVTFSDPGTPDTHDVTWDWGDDSTPNSQMNVTSPASQDHTYAQPGVYMVTITVTDDDGDNDVGEFQFIVIYDPDGGFVTGGGWIDSPEGACTFEDCTEQTVGKANFGFVSKYKNGASVPTGETEFQFKAGDLNFHSTSYDWLVIAGQNAKFKGEGTVNNQPDYGFMLTACDVDVNGNCQGEADDTFRIKIWDTQGTANEADDEVIYDNKRGEPDDSNDGTVLGGGNIKIHKPKSNLVLDAAGAVPSAGVATLTQSSLDAAVSQAIDFWAFQGFDAEQLNALRQVDVYIDDLAGDVLATASPSDHAIWIDDDAAGFGWTLLSADSVWQAGNGVDLLSSMAHEFGHLLGLDHDVLDSTLRVGERSLPQLPDHGDANRDGAFNRFDLSDVLQRGKYLTRQDATWEEGDWNGDHRFDQLDIVAALQLGKFRNDDSLHPAVDVVFGEVGGGDGG